MRMALKILERTALPTPIHIRETSFFLYAGNIRHILSKFKVANFIPKYVKTEE